MFSNTYAVIDGNGLILNNVVLEEGAEWTPPEGTSIAPNEDGMEIGGTFIGGVYTAPTSTTVVVPPSAVNAERERRIQEPWIVQMPSNGAVFQVNMDTESQRNIQGLSTIGIVLKTAAPMQNTMFRDYVNKVHALTPDDLISMGLQIAARIQSVYQKAWALKDNPPIPEDYADDKHW